MVYALDLFARAVPEGHDLTQIQSTGATQRPVAESSNLRDLFSVEQFNWACGALPVFVGESYFILSMVESNSRGWSPAKEGSKSAECALLEVNDGKVTRRIVEGLIANGNHQTVIPGRKIGTGKVPNLEQNYILLNSGDPRLPPMFVAAPCESQKTADPIKKDSGVMIGIKTKVNPENNGPYMTEQKTIQVQPKKEWLNMSVKSPKTEDEI